MIKSNGARMLMAVFVLAVLISVALWAGFYPPCDGGANPEPQGPVNDAAQIEIATPAKMINGEAAADESSERSLVAVDTAKSETGADLAKKELPSELWLDFVPPSGQQFLGAAVSFESEGQRCTATVTPGNLSTRLGIEDCLPKEQSKYLGLLRVEAPGCARYCRWLLASEFTGTGAIAIEIALEPASSIQVQVLDNTGANASEAVITVNRLSDSASPGTVRDWRFEADGEGRALLTGLSPGEWEIQATHWKDWEPSGWTTVRLSSDLNEQSECVLIVQRWASATYSSGRLARSRQTDDGVSYLEDCDFPQRSYPVFGDEFFVRVWDDVPVSVRAVSKSGKKLGECFQLRGGLHRLHVLVD